MRVEPIFSKCMNADPEDGDSPEGACPLLNSECGSDKETGDDCCECLSLARQDLGSGRFRPSSLVVIVGVLLWSITVGFFTCGLLHFRTGQGDHVDTDPQNEHDPVRDEVSMTEAAGDLCPCACQDTGSNANVPVPHELLRQPVLPKPLFLTTLHPPVAAPPLTTAAPPSTRAPDSFELLDHLRVKKSSNLEIRDGTLGVARSSGPIFASVTSWKQIGKLEEGQMIVAAGPPEIADGYLLLPIKPRGAVEVVLLKFQDPGWKCHEWDEKDQAQPGFESVVRKTAVCERDRGDMYEYKFTYGNNQLIAPGCGQCWCCKRELLTPNGGHHSEFSQVRRLVSNLTEKHEDCTVNRAGCQGKTRHLQDTVHMVQTPHVDMQHVPTLTLVTAAPAAYVRPSTPAPFSIASVNMRGETLHVNPSSITKAVESQMKPPHMGKTTFPFAQVKPRVVGEIVPPPAVPIKQAQKGTPRPGSPPIQDLMKSGWDKPSIPRENHLHSPSLSGDSRGADDRPRPRAPWPITKPSILLPPQRSDASAQTIQLPRQPGETDRTQGQCLDGDVCAYGQTWCSKSGHESMTPVGYCAKRSCNGPAGISTFPNHTCGNPSGAELNVTELLSGLPKYVRWVLSDIPWLNGIIANAMVWHKFDDFTLELDDVLTQTFEWKLENSQARWLVGCWPPQRYVLTDGVVHFPSGRIIVRIAGFNLVVSVYNLRAQFSKLRGELQCHGGYFYLGGVGKDEQGDPVTVDRFVSSGEATVQCETSFSAFCMLLFVTRQQISNEVIKRIPLILTSWLGSINGLFLGRGCPGGLRNTFTVLPYETKECCESQFETDRWGCLVSGQFNGQHRSLRQPVKGVKCERSKTNPGRWTARCSTVPGNYKEDTPGVCREVDNLPPVGNCTGCSKFWPNVKRGLHLLCWADWFLTVSLIWCTVGSCLIVCRPTGWFRRLRATDADVLRVSHLPSRLFSARDRSVRGR